jgi:hypothetical protein
LKRTKFEKDQDEKDQVWKGPSLKRVKNENEQDAMGKVYVRSHHQKLQTKILNKNLQMENNFSKKHT